jgi:NAD(P)-dependent dehydrogenase (short-subunit alcohol dehydrogenase family)
MGVFANQVVIVTGASEGIGRAFCRVLAPDRPRLVLAAGGSDVLVNNAGGTMWTRGDPRQALNPRLRGTRRSGTGNTRRSG